MRTIFGIYGGIMALCIRSPGVERKARELSRESGQTMTDVIEAALDAKREAQDEARAQLRSRLTAVGAHCAALPDLDTRRAEEILGYDESGAFEHGH